MPPSTTQFGVHAIQLTQMLIMHKLIQTQAHLGQSPAGLPTGSRMQQMQHYQPFLLGFRNQLAIINLDTTLRYLKRACAFIKHINTQHNQHARLLLVNTNTHSQMNVLIKQTALSSPQTITFINTPWIGGLLTNSSHTSHKNVHPNCIIVFNAHLASNSTAIQEAHRLRIPSIALVDTNTPKTIHAMISYPIPAHLASNSLQFVYILCNCIVLLSKHNHV